MEPVGRPPPVHMSKSLPLRAITHGKKIFSRLPGATVVVATCMPARSTLTSAGWVPAFATTTAKSNTDHTGLYVTVGQKSQPTYVRPCAAAAHVVGSSMLPLPPVPEPVVGLMPVVDDWVPVSVTVLPPPA